MGDFRLAPFMAWERSVLWVGAIWIALEPRLLVFRNTWPYACLVGTLGCVSLLFLSEEHEFIYFNF
jgi:hypothetical protein